MQKTLTTGFRQEQLERQRGADQKQADPNVSSHTPQHGHAPFPENYMKFPGNYTLGLDKWGKCAYNIHAFGVWRSLVSRLVRVQEAPGSNPGTLSRMDGGNP